MPRRRKAALSHDDWDIVNSGEVDARSDGATPISNRRATSDDVTNFSSIDYTYTILAKPRNGRGNPLFISLLRRFIIRSSGLNSANHFI
ncbi:MAG: palindromic element RPE2 domain-containing protein [Rickettsia endosymbiont of Culicoides impunctatus]|nr:MAG: palindromic element RPE2 domain-containing protein [Rickettsia endosymbiont of Culicoides impunctatus]